MLQYTAQSMNSDIVTAHTNRATKIAHTPSYPKAECRFRIVKHFEKSGQIPQS